MGPSLADACGGLGSLSVLPGDTILRRGAGLAFSRQTLLQYLLPAAAFTVAVGIELSGVSIHEWSSPTQDIGGTVAARPGDPDSLRRLLHHAEQIASRMANLRHVVSPPPNDRAPPIVSPTLHGENNSTLARESVFSTVMIELRA